MHLSDWCRNSYVACSRSKRREHSVFNKNSIPFRCVKVMLLPKMYYWVSIGNTAAVIHSIIKLYLSLWPSTYKLCYSVATDEKLCYLLSKRINRKLLVNASQFWRGLLACAAAHYWYSDTLGARKRQLLELYHREGVRVWCALDRASHCESHFQQYDGSLCGRWLWTPDEREGRQAAISDARQRVSTRESIGCIRGQNLHLENLLGRFFRF